MQRLRPVVNTISIMGDIGVFWGLSRDARSLCTPRRLGTRVVRGALRRRGSYLLSYEFDVTTTPYSQMLKLCENDLWRKTR